jgi:hypothetical protein
MKTLTTSFILGLLAVVSIQASTPSGGLLAHYSFEENMLDSEGNYNASDPTSALGFPNPFVYIPSTIDSGNYAIQTTIDGTFSLGTPAPTGNAARTISIWAQTTHAELHLFQAGNTDVYNSTNPDGFVWEVRNTQNPTTLSYEDSLFFRSQGTGNAITSSAFQLNSDWNHYVLTYDGTNQTNLKMYMNGTELALDGLTNVQLTTDTSDQFVGNFRTTTRAYDELGIWDRALTSLEISELYTSNLIPEPNTYALLLGLLALTATIVRRRN